MNTLECYVGKYCILQTHFSSHRINWSIIKSKAQIVSFDTAVNAKRPNVLSIDLKLNIIKSLVWQINYVGVRSDGIITFVHHKRSHPNVPAQASTTTCPALCGNFIFTGCAHALRRHSCPVAVRRLGQAAISGLWPMFITLHPSVNHRFTKHRIHSPFRGGSRRNGRKFFLRFFCY